MSPWFPEGSVPNKESSPITIRRLTTRLRELRAGRTGYELLRKPDVAALISTLDDEKRKATGVDEPWVVDQLKAIVEASMLGRPRRNARGELILDVRTGQPIIDTDYTNANRALQTLSRIAGLQVRKAALYSDTVEYLRFHPLNAMVNPILS